MRFRLLGPLEVWNGAAWSEIRSAQQRTVLAVLLIEVGRVVTSDRLVDEIWGERPPRTAVNAVQGYVMRLRQLMRSGSTSDRPASPLVTQGRGYRLLAEEDDLDSAVFDRLVESGQHHLSHQRLREGATRLTEALALWRGPAFADVPAGPSVVVAAHQLEQGRLRALEERLDAELELGRHAEVVDELHRLVAEQPLRERALALLMLALHRCGRRGEALNAYRTGRHALVHELGVEPGARLRELARAILAEDGLLVPERVPIAKAAPAQLPPDVAAFTGRATYLRKLDKYTPNGRHLEILTITGTAGVGKTALAVHWAHRVLHRFPDGQLYVNLRGYAAGTPLRPVEVLARFLFALEVPANRIPADEDLAAALYRSQLADTRTLVVLDNARDAAQIRPLLPGSPGCLVLVTGRDQLRGLVAVDGATSLSIPALTGTEAVALLALLLGSDRIDAEPKAAAELARLCGHLPLALRIVAANLSAHPRRSIAEHVTRLRTGDRLGALQVDGDPQVGVRATIDHSYAALPLPARRLFRLLGLIPGQDVTVAAAAALAGIAPDVAADLLDQLMSAHLLEEHAATRYAMHDLLRLYAAEQACPAEDEAALHNLLRHYLTFADVAARMLYPEKLRLPVPDVDCEPPRFDDKASAMAWLDAERTNLVAAVRYAADHGQRATAVLLADTLRGYFDIGMYTVDWLVVAQLGLRCAEQEGDSRAQAAAGISLALLNWKQSRYTQAVEYYTQVIALTDEADWPAGHAAALGNLGKVYADLGRLQLAAECHAKALAIDQQAGWLTGQATKLGNLGEVYLDLGRLAEAKNTFTEALDLHRQVGSDGSESIVLRGLAVAHRDLGNQAEAQRSATEAVAVARGIGGQRQLAKALNTLATIRHDAGDDQEAMACHLEALELARERSDRYGEIEALTGLAAVSSHTRHAEDAVALAHQVGSRTLAARALTSLATVQLTSGRPRDAVATTESALTIHAETGQRLCLARTHQVAGNALLAIGEQDKARGHLEAARTLFAETGADSTAHA